MDNVVIIKIAQDFSDTPGGRYVAEGDHSGEAFRDEVLIPKYEEAVREGKRLVVNLDGCYGLATSFLEEAFGGLVRKKKNRDILKFLEIVSEDRPNLNDKIMGYIKEANIDD